MKGRPKRSTLGLPRGPRWDVVIALRVYSPRGGQGCSPWGATRGRGLILPIGTGNERIEGGPDAAPASSIQ